MKPFADTARHAYSPDIQAMGDCRICGNVRDAPCHGTVTGRWVGGPVPTRRDVPLAGGTPNEALVNADFSEIEKRVLALQQRMEDEAKDEIITAGRFVPPL